MNTSKKTLHEDFAHFFEYPTRVAFRDVLKNNIGELPNCDFKEQWPSFPKLARHLLGMSNSEGGCLVIGVAQKKDNTFEAKGLDNAKDKSDIFSGIEKYMPSTLVSNSIEIIDFSYSDAEYSTLIGKKFQVVLVEDDLKHIPFLCSSDGEDIRKNAIYVRRGTSTVEANHEELQQIINRRIETGYSTQREIDLEVHIQQLKILFKQLDRHYIQYYPGYPGSLLDIITRGVTSSLTIGEKMPNPKYPDEDFESFIARMVKKKKKRIEIELDVASLND